MLAACAEAMAVSQSQEDLTLEAAAAAGGGPSCQWIPSQAVKGQGKAVERQRKVKERQWKGSRRSMDDSGKAAEGQGKAVGKRPEQAELAEVGRSGELNQHDVLARRVDLRHLVTMTRTEGTR